MKLLRAIPFAFVRPPSSKGLTMRRSITTAIASLALAVSLGTAITAKVAPQSGWLTTTSGWASSFVDKLKQTPLRYALGSTQTQQEASVSTDRPDYAPGEWAIILGSGFEPGEEVTLQVVHVTGGVDGRPGHDPWPVQAAEDGSIQSEWYVDPYDSLDATFLLTAVGATSGLRAEWTFTDATAANLDQCRNGAAEAPVNCNDGSTPGGQGWVNGNAGKENSHFVEGYSIPYRARMTELPVGQTITMTLGYDIRNSGKNAIDFLTHYQRLQPHAAFGHPTEIVSPLSGVSGVSATST